MSSVFLIFSGGVSVFNKANKKPAAYVGSYREFLPQNISEV